MRILCDTLRIGPGRAGGGRNSNIEMLRLLSMLMVLILHSFWGFKHGSGIFQAIDIFRNCAAICAVDVFLLISGYFGIKWKLKSIFTLIFQLFFYAFLVYGVAAIIGVIEFSFSGLMGNITCLFTHWSFITCYLLLYLCAPLLNAFVERVSQKQLLGFIIILVISENLITRKYGFLNYCTMYLIGRYIANSNIINDLKIKAGRLYWIITALMFVLVYATFKLLHFDSVAMQSVPWGLDYAAPLVILQAVFLLVWFARLKLNSSFINWCSVSCLSIYLIHMHPAIKQIGYYDYTESLYSVTVIEHVWKLLVLILVVFLGSILIDKIRILFSTIFYKLFLWVISVTGVSKTNILSYIPNIVSKN